jgi:hypothetical protein
VVRDVWSVRGRVRGNGCCPCASLSADSILEGPLTPADCGGLREGQGHPYGCAWFDDGVAMTERLCACGCGRSLDGMRSKARYASGACRTRDWKRRKGITGIRYTKASQNGKSGPPGLQQSHPRSVEQAEAMLRCADDERIRTGSHRPTPELAREFMAQALSARQREQLEQKEAA